MAPSGTTFLRRLGRRLAGPLSSLMVNGKARVVAESVEMFGGLLLGKAAGYGWGVEVEVEAALSTVRSKEPVVFDVGANVGNWSLEFSRRCPGSRIFMFEPQTACQKLINELNIPNSVLIPKAVSSSAGTAPFFCDGTSSYASLFGRRDSSVKVHGLELEPTSIETVILDGVIEDFGLPRIDFVKMDIEGNEVAALQGATKSLETRKIRALSFEIGSSNVNSRTFFCDFWEILCPRGYSIFRILPCGKLLPVPEYSETCENFRGCTNYVAVAEGPNDGKC